MNRVGDELSEGFGKMLKKTIVLCYEAQFLGVSEKNNEFLQ
jgi:hypothetical protein